ncbi:RNA-directed DNA polymerase, eukaryota, reverse transcriptase zinc-binding domain protein, partial [Tanacetum coccineum]
MSKRRSSKRIPKIPLKFGDSICDFSKNKHKFDSVVKDKDVRCVDHVVECNSEEVMVESGIQEEEEICGQNMDEVIQSMDVNNVTNLNSQSNVSTPEIVNNVTNNNGNEVLADNVSQTNCMKFGGNVSSESYAKIASSGNNEEGSRKWQLAVCGHFVGCNMPLGELKYNLRRMWGKHGLSEIIADGSDMRIFKFRNAEGMNYVIDQSPWMVNGKPLVVQKWDPDVVFEKEEPCKIPICGSGRVGYARILVEIDAKKGIQDKIEVVYKDAQNCTKRTKHVKVEYTWRPALCNHCGVFGHNDNTCRHQMKDDVGKRHGKEQVINDEIGKHGR